MFKCLRVFLIGIVALLATDVVKAQDPAFTQFYANPLYLNPAFAGAQRCPRIIMNYRNEWPGITGTYVTYSASYDQHVDVLQGGLGLLVTNDRAGESTLTTTTASLIYSYQLNVTRRFSIKTGFQATYFQKKVDWDKLNFGDQIDPKYGFIYPTQEQEPQTSLGYMDFSAGIMGFSEKFFAGYAAHHLTEPDEAFIVSGSSELPMKHTVHVGAMLDLYGGGEEAFISPNILYQKQQDFQQVNLGVYIIKGPLVGGLWYRHTDSFIALVGFQEGPIKFGYSYDVTISRLANASQGSHEFSFALQFRCRPKKKRFRTINCPSF